MTRIAKISLDIRKNGVIENEPVVLRQGESDVIIEASILNDGYKNLDIDFATFVAKKPDGTIISNDPANTSGNVISYPISKHLTESVGKIQDAYFMIDNRVTTDGFEISIIPSTQLDANSINYIPGIESVDKFLSKREAEWLGRIQKMKDQIAGLDIPTELKLLINKSLDEAKAQYQPMIDDAKSDVDDIVADLSAKKMDLESNSDGLNQTIINIKNRIKSIDSFLDDVQKQIIESNSDFTSEKQKQIAQLISDNEKKLSESTAAVQEQSKNISDDLKAQGQQVISDLRDSSDTAIKDMQGNQSAAMERVDKDVTEAKNNVKQMMESFKTYDGLGNPWLDDVNQSVISSLSSYASNLNTSDGVIRILNLQDVHLTRSEVANPAYVKGGHAAIKQLHAISILKDKVDLIVSNGDNIDGSETREFNVHRDQQYTDTIHGVFDKKPVLLTIGNHDDGSVWLDGADVITLDELTKIYNYPRYSSGENRLYGTSSYSYFDFPSAKLRAISLSGFENPEVYNDDGTLKYKRANSSVFTQNQLNWLVKALTINSDWSVIIFNHSPYEGFYGNLPYSYMNNVNHDILKDILTAFINGDKVTDTGDNIDFPVSITADFSSQGKGTLITNVFGHEHRDVDKTVTDGITAIERTCDIALTDDRKIGTASEFAFDVIEVDTTNRHIKFNRFGSGNSAEWDY